MLYQEQNYLAPPAPSVAGFKAWLERQPQSQRFDYANCRRCAVGQYLTSLGTSWDEYIDVNVNYLMHLNSFPCRVATFENRLRPTFGDVLREVRKVCP